MLAGTPSASLPVVVYLKVYTASIPGSSLASLFSSKKLEGDCAPISIETQGLKPPFHLAPLKVR